MSESKVADLSLADFGRREIELAEVEMPGLMACRAQYGKEKPLKGAKISGSLHMTVQTAVLIETLKELGADLRWASCNIFSTQDHAAAAIAESESAAVFAWKRMSLKDYWDCTFRALSWPNSEGPDMLVDDGGDATLLIHEGVKVEKIYAETGELPDPSSAENEEFSIILDLLKESLASDPQRWHKISKNVIGVSEETTTGVNRLRQMSESGNLLFSAINVNDSVTKSKFDNIYGCRHSLPDGLMRATDVMLAGKSVLICGYGDVGKGCSQAMKSAGARVSISEIDPICALQACMEGLSVVRLNDVVSDIDIFITATGNKSVITADHISQMKNNAIVANIGHFDNEIDVENLGDYPGVVRQNIKPEVDRWVFPDGHGVIILSEGRLMNLGNATGHPSFVMSASFTNQVLAQLDLWKNKNTGMYSKKLYTLSKSIDEHVARLHLDKLDAKLTTLSDEQANYLGIPSSGPFKHETYRY